VKCILSVGDITDVGLDTNCNDDTYIQVRGQHQKSKKAAVKSQPAQRTDITVTNHDNNHSTTASVSASELSHTRFTALNYQSYKKSFSSYPL